MKLLAQTYISPLANQGTFTNVTIEDVCLTHKRNEKYISIAFEMSYLKNNQKVVLANVTLGFLGMETDKVSSNRTTTVSIPNPNYDSQIEGSQTRSTVPLFAYLKDNKGVMPTDYIVVDYGYPNYEKVMQYFKGGTLENPEINITDSLALGFLLNNLIINGEAVGKQFKII